MNKLLTTVLSILFIVIVTIAVMKMMGLGDLVSDAGDIVRAKIGKQEKRAEFARQSLGWDILEIDKKPVTVVIEGKRRLQKVIDNLNREKLKVGVVKRSAEIKNEDSEGERTHLRSIIEQGMAILKDESAQYPLKIGTLTYADKHMLLVAVKKAQQRYTALKGAATLTSNNPVRAEALQTEIDDRLAIAYGIMELLDARLTMAETDESRLRYGEANEELKGLTSKARELLSAEQTSDLPSQYDGGDSRLMNQVNKFEF